MLGSVTKHSDAHKRFQKKFLTTSSGNRVEYLHIDRGKDRTVIFLNGWLLRFSEWSLQMPSLWDFNLLLLNNRGHGGSGLGDSTAYTYLFDCARDVYDLTQNLSVRNPDVVAHSMGTLISLYFYELMKGDVRTLTLVSPLVSNPMKTFTYGHFIEKNLYRIESIVRHQTFKNTFDHISRIISSSSVLFPFYVYFRLLTNSEIAYKTFSKYIRDSLEVDPVTAFISMRSMILLGDSLGEQFSKVKTPIMVVYGENDMFVNPSVINVIKSRAPRAFFEIFENATHYPHAEQPRRFNKIMYTFLSRY